MFERTFSPIKINTVEIPNRIVRTAHVTLLSHSGLVNDDLIAYHLERAKGGVGLSILEAASVHPSSGLALVNRDDSVIPHYQRLSRAVASTEMKIFAQLWHGGHIYPAADGGPPWAASAIPGRYSMMPPIAMTIDQIHELIDAFAAAAARVEAGGLHGVEFHAGHGYLPMQFLSAILNRREDEYGGSWENRLRFLLEALRAIRKATSPGFPLGIRLSESADPRVLSLEEANAAALRVQQENLVDFVNISHGDYYHSAECIAGMDRPTGYQLPTAKQIGAGVKVPKIVAGRFGTLDDVEQALRAGDADLVSMVRAHIADPQLVAKSRAGRSGEVRPCIACNQGCIGGAIVRGRVGCVVNPAAGLEMTLSEDLLGRTDSARRVLIIGGGPAGMEAARMAALRGHRVTLVEAAPRLGGMLNYARRLPNLRAIGDIAVWLESEIYRLGVEVRMSTYMEAADVREAVPDVLLIATGSETVDAVQQAADPVGSVLSRGAPIIGSEELIDRQPGSAGQSAVVVDDTGHYEAIGCCEDLLRRGLHVTYITRHTMFAAQIEPTMRTQSALRRLHDAGTFRVITQALLVSIGGGEAQIKPLYASHSHSVPADLAVIVAHRKSSSQLWLELGKAFHESHLIGDALSARDLQTAIREGHMAGRNIQ